ncbi:small glutamine-rich tetratricopeptide repeat-containing protein 2-like [Phragmites australis]|uniref:small glutamine-rich tetratricopeptide repeat-containing protein 2-like n=1 Tax=Phragmites australis TaxID=29695 RepID=UPI002D779B0A|nr:small glutamine-rich tetratricopeptide repeat-containing protein 2-like [Phragmites australis]
MAAGPSHTAMAVAVAVAGVTTTNHSSIASARRRPPSFRRLNHSPRASGAVEVRVCTNRTCARQGAREVLAALVGLAPPRVDVASCGCLGRCGAGPNVAASVAGSAAVFGHVGTAARGAQLLEHLLGAAEFDATSGLAALAMRENAEAAHDKGNAAEAEALLTEAICLNACGGLHLVYSSRSKARLTLGDISGALEDAEEAIRIAPKFPLANLLRGDALLAMGEYCGAEDAYADALDLDPSIRRSKSFKARVERLREKLVGASCSS